MSQSSQSAISSVPISVRQLIAVIEQRQAVVNKDRLNASALDTTVSSLAVLDKADAGHLSFVNDEHYAKQLPNSKAGVIITTSSYADSIPKTTVAIEVGSPYLAYASCSALFDGDNPVTAFGNSVDTSDTSANTQQGKLSDGQGVYVHPTAYVDKSAHLGSGVYVGANCFVDKNCRIGDGSYLQAGVVIEAGSVLGANCRIMANVVIHHHCQLGDDVHIHAGAVIGSGGFGYAPYQYQQQNQEQHQRQHQEQSQPSRSPSEQKTLQQILQQAQQHPQPQTSPQRRWQPIAQVGRVVIGHRVRIGANTCIDRGAIEDTVIGDDVIIDNLVQVAHNVHLGQGTAIAANTAIAGSTHIGERCIIAGAVGISGHLTITDDVTITAMTMVTKSIDKAGSYSSGIPIMPTADWRRAVVNFRQSGRKR